MAEDEKLEVRGRKAREETELTESGRSILKSFNNLVQLPKSA